MTSLKFRGNTINVKLRGQLALEHLRELIKSKLGIFALAVLGIWALASLVNSDLVEDAIVPHIAAHSAKGGVPGKSGDKQTLVQAPAEVIYTQLKCEQAQQWREVFTCTERGEYITLDNDLRDAFYPLYDTLNASAKKRLREDQNNWLRQTDRCGEQINPGKCLKNLTEARIKILNERLSNFSE